MLIPEKQLGRVLRLYLGGTRGGLARLKILLLLKERPLNTNQLARALGMDYTTAMYHLRILEKAGLAVPEKKAYDARYSLTPLLASLGLEEMAILEKAFKSRGK